MGLRIKETYCNRTEDCMIGESDWYEPFTDDKGELFRSLQREYGRCTGHVYVDRFKTQDIEPHTESLPGAASYPVAVGWVFEKLRSYEDSIAETYLHEVWVCWE